MLVEVFRYRAMFKRQMMNEHFTLYGLEFLAISQPISILAISLFVWQVIVGNMTNC